MKQVEHLALGKLMYQINDNKDKGIILILTKEQCQEIINGYMGIKNNYEKLTNAIDIIKKHDIRPINHLGCLRFGYNEYNCHLTDEEYELLKEVLKDVD